MLATSDVKTYFGTSLDTDQAFIEHIYLNTLGKTYAGDTAGVEYWVSRLEGTNTDGEAKLASTDELLAHLLGAAKDATNDAATLTNKLTFAETVYGTTGTFTAESLSTATITDDVATLTAANTALDTFVADNTVVPTPVVTPTTYALTAGADAPTLTSANDTIDGSSVVNSLTANDTIIDASTEDSDTLNVSTGVANVKATVKNIENVNFDWTSNADLDVDASNMSGNTFDFTANGLAFSGAATITNAGSNDFNFDSNTSGTVTLTNVVKSTIDAGAATTVVVDTGAATVVGQKTTADITLNNNATVTNKAGDLVEELTLSASKDATIKINDGVAASAIADSLTVTGANDVIIEGVVTAEKIVNSKDSGTLTVKSTDTGATDVSKIDADTIQLSKNAGAITVADNQTLEVITGGAPTTIQTLATLSNVTTNIKTNVDIAALNLTAGATDISTLNLEAAKNVSVSMTADATQTTNVTGTGNLTLNSTGVSAVDANALTGTFTYTQAGNSISGIVGSSTAKNTIDFSNITSANATFVGGSETDKVTLSTYGTGTAKITTAAGDDTLTLSGAVDETGTVIVDLGAGADTVKITNVNGAATATGASKVSFAGVETIVGMDDVVLNNVQLSGQTYTMTGTGSDNLIVYAYDKTSAATEATTDLSKLVFTDTVGNDFSTTDIFGLNGVKDTILATKLDDTIDAGTKKDTIDISQGGNDIIKIAAIGDSTWAKDADNMDSVTGFDAVVTATAFDKLAFATDVTATAIASTTAVSAITGGTGNETVNATIDASSMLTLSGVDADQINTLEEWIAVAKLAIEAADDADDTDANTDGIQSSNDVNGQTVGFEFAGNTYVYNAIDTQPDGAIDSFDIVELVGVTGITALEFGGTAAANTIVVG